MSEQIRKEIIIFSTGGAIYPVLEIIWRGYSHISMAIAGGLCMYFINKLCCQKLKSKRLYVKCFAGSAVITCVELIVGIIVNLGFGLNVWDYSSVPFNLLGQVCLQFSAIWFFLTIPAIFLCNKINKLELIKKAPTTEAGATE